MEYDGEYIDGPVPGCPQYAAGGVAVSFNSLTFYKYQIYILWQHPAKV